MFLRHCLFITLAASACTQPAAEDPIGPGGKGDGSEEGDRRTMIGRCSYDNGPGSTDGTFRVGTAVANFYRVESDRGEPTFEVAHGISRVSGSIVSKTDTLEIFEQGPTQIDQGTLWPVYPLVFEQTEPILAHWIDATARELFPADPPKSGVGYQNPLGTVKAATGVGSALQSYVVGRPTIYPFCIFWENP